MFMAENFDNIPEPAEPRLFNVEKSNGVSQNQSHFRFQAPEAVLFAEINDWKQKFRDQQERAENLKKQLSLALVQINEM